MKCVHYHTGTPKYTLQNYDFKTMQPKPVFLYQNIKAWLFYVMDESYLVTLMKLFYILDVFSAIVVLLFKLRLLYYDIIICYCHFKWGCHCLALSQGYNVINRAAADMHNQLHTNAPQSKAGRSVGCCLFYAVQMLHYVHMLL